MMTLFCETLEDVSNDPEIKCLVIKGQGSSWCAGVDVGDHKPDMADEMIATFNRSLLLLEALEMPTRGSRARRVSGWWHGIRHRM